MARKSVWLSGEICEIPGIYFSDTCGHSIRKEFSSRDIFTRCPICYMTIRWMRFGGWTAWEINSRPDLDQPKRPQQR